MSNPSGSVVSTKKNFFWRGNFRQLSNQNVQIWDHFFQLLFPKDSKSLKILNIRLREVGAKRCLNSTSKVNTQTDKQTDSQTDRQTDRQTDISTYRKHRPRGRCFENYIYLSKRVRKERVFLRLAGLLLGILWASSLVYLWEQPCQSLLFYSG